jgi:HK97 gp10 family phage protein
MAQLAFTVVTVPGEITAQKRMQMKALGNEVESIAKGFAPVDTGFLRESIYTWVDGNSLVLESNADYASFVEYGTYKEEAQPFLRPAIEESQDMILEVLTDTSIDMQEVQNDLKTLSLTLKMFKI